MKPAVQITVLGQQYTVRSDTDSEEVFRVVDLVNRHIAEAAASSRTADTLNTAVLALLNLGGAFLQLQETGSTREVERRLLQLVEKLEQAVPES